MKKREAQWFKGHMFDSQRWTINENDDKGESETLLIIYPYLFLLQLTCQPILNANRNLLTVSLLY